MMSEGVLKRPSAVLVVESDGEVPRLTKAESSDDPDGRTVFIVVSLVGGAEEKIGVLEECHGEPADEVHVVTAGSAPSELNGVDSVSEVNRPGDLTGLSMKIGAVLSEAHEDDVYLYFDDITCLLQYTDLRTAFRFLNTLTGRLYGSDGIGYFEMNPEAHDEQTWSTVASLFDDTVGEIEAARQE